MSSSLPSHLLGQPSAAASTSCPTTLPLFCVSSALASSSTLKTRPRTRHRRAKSSSSSSVASGRLPEPAERLWVVWILVQLASGELERVIDALQCCIGHGPDGASMKLLQESAVMGMVGWLVLSGLSACSSPAGKADEGGQGGTAAGGSATGGSSTGGSTQSAG